MIEMKVLDFLLREGDPGTLRILDDLLKSRGSLSKRIISPISCRRPARNAVSGSLIPIRWASSREANAAAKELFKDAG